MEPTGIRRANQTEKTLKKATSDPIRTLRSMTETDSIPATRFTRPSCANPARGLGIKASVEQSPLAHSTRRSTRQRVIDTVLCGLVVFLIALLALTYHPTPAQAAQRGTVEYCTQNARDLAKRLCIIRVTFAVVGQSEKAVSVAMCESGANPRALNGQYHGAFQMGASERKRFGHGPSIVTQSQAALRYYRVSGWSPWDCA